MICTLKKLNGLVHDDHSVQNQIRRECLCEIHNLICVGVGTH